MKPCKKEWIGYQTANKGTNICLLQEQVYIWTSEPETLQNSIKTEKPIVPLYTQQHSN